MPIGAGLSANVNNVVTVLVERTIFLIMLFNLSVTRANVISEEITIA